jgi:hypothetical protein
MSFFKYPLIIIERNFWIHIFVAIKRIV